MFVDRDELQNYYATIEMDTNKKGEPIGEKSLRTVLI